MKLLLLFVIIAVSSTQIKSQQNKFDILFHKYLGRQEGRVIKIEDKTVEFRLTKTNLLYKYPKEEIKYIILINGEWIAFTDSFDTNNKINFKPTGSFILSAGKAITVGRGVLENQKKSGYEFRSELSYNASSIYSIGFMIGYSFIRTDETKLLLNNNYPLSNSSANAGNVYHLRVGLNNRFMILPSFSLVPEVNIYFGYSNQIISESTIISSSVVNKIPDNIEKGIELGVGVGFLIKTGHNYGLIINWQYSRIFQKRKGINFLYFDMGYSVPIN